ncbi:Aspartyl aminopeptidase [Spironucleus salmonicida]|uniref:aspartyl aminopeptidase n=2 Tax=Spironucleus salmonicida TaxID=348837 RepID=V6LDP9_9EUKA|nr:Aspartyl aminopeptidase [Spironucleus salmonicida]|eukprot:EST41806.1 M18 family aminopeptidase [Spironucleus salmonicida]
MLTFEEFISASPSPYHSVKTAVDMLVSAGFKHIRESEVIPSNTPCVYTRDGTAVIGWIPGTDFTSGFTSVQSHTDSPCLRFVQSGAIKAFGTLMSIPVEPYSGLVVGRFIDRKLRVGGRISYIVEKDGKFIPASILVKSEGEFVIPGLAPHMLRNPGDPKDWIPEGDDFVLCCPKTVTINGKQIEVKEKATMNDLFAPLLPVGAIISATQIDISAIEFNRYGSLIQAPRIDNLASLYGSVVGLINSFKNIPTQASTRMIAGFNHEEIGSRTRSGAAGIGLHDWWLRVCQLPSDIAIAAMHKSLNISADGAHANHPAKGASSCHDPIPVLGSGVCLKFGQKQNYAFTDNLSAVVIAIAKNAGVSTQKWVGKSFKAGGGTIGNLVAADCDMKVVDMGLPMLAMHSCLEMIDEADLKGFEVFCARVHEQGNAMLGLMLQLHHE